jgi:hypothetical protein
MIKVFDEFIPEYHQECLLKQLEVVRWNHSDNVSGMAYETRINGAQLSHDQSGYYHNVFSPDKEETDGILLGLCLPMIALAKSFIEKKVVLERVRAGRFTKSKHYGIHRPHTDYFTDHYTLLYYANDSDGDTFLFDNVAESSNPVYPSEFNLAKTVSPKMGRAILFDGLIYHASSAPIINDQRIAININLMVSS